MDLAGSRQTKLHAGLWSIPLSIEDEACAPLGESLRDDLRVECVWKDLRPILKRPVRGDGGRATVIVALRDNLERELCLRRIHREDGEVIDHEKVSAHITPKCALQNAMHFGGAELVEHARRRHDDD